MSPRDVGRYASKALPVVRRSANANEEGSSGIMRRIGLRTVRRLPQIAANLLTVALFILVLRPVERILFRFSLVGHSPFPDPAHFAWVSSLERDWWQIREELDQVMRQAEHIPSYLDLSDDAKGLTDEKSWKSFFFYAYGERIAANCERCPRTAALLQRIDGLKSGFFSIMLPGTHLLPHRGHFAGVLRYHLGLIVPDVERCRLRVADRVVHWHEGKSIIFDDTFEHEVWNESDGVRVVLFVDFVRPLPQPLAALNHTLIWLVAKSSIVQPGLRRVRDWNQRFAAAWQKAAG